MKAIQKFTKTQIPNITRRFGTAHGIEGSLFTEAAERSKDDLRRHDAASDEAAAVGRKAAPQKQDARQGAARHARGGRFHEVAADAAAGARRARAGLQRRHRVGAAAAEAAVDQVRGLRPARPDVLRAAAVAAAADVGARAATAARAPGFRRAVPGDAARRLQRSYDPRRDGRLLGAAPGRRAPRVRAAAGARVSHPAAAARVDLLVARRKMDSSRSPAFSPQNPLQLPCGLLLDAHDRIDRLYLSG